MNITEDQAREVLNPYQEDLQECILSSWTDYHNHCHGIQHILSKRSRANIIFDFIVHNINQKFHGKRNIFISNNKRLFLVNFENKVVIRFKKLRHNRASCIPTQQTIDFFRQIEIPEIPTPERFVVGYHLNHMQTEIKNISVVYPQTSSQNYWAYDLEPMEAKVFEYVPKQSTIDHDVTKERITIKKNTTGTGEAINEQANK